MGSGYNSLKPMAKSENEVAPKLVTVTGSVGDVIRGGRSATTPGSTHPVADNALLFLNMP